MSHADQSFSVLSRTWWALYVPLGTLLGYCVVAILALSLGLSPVWATIVTGVITAACVLALRARKPPLFDPGARAGGEVAARGRLPRNMWLPMILALGLAFLAGQVLGMLVLTSTGGAGFEHSVADREAGGVLPALLLSLLIAPVAEEALMRGLVYPLLRRRLSTVVSVILTLATFAVMHMNAVQMLAVAPLSVLLCWIYERTNSLAACMAGHFLFNVAALTVPAGLIGALTNPVAGVVLTVLFICAMVLLRQVDWHCAHEREIEHS